MNNLRRKLVLGSPLFSVGLFAGCGGGDSVGINIDDRRRTLAIDDSALQSLQLHRAGITQPPLDDIWDDINGGKFLIPSAFPSIQALVNGTALYLSLNEQVNLSSDVRVIRSLVMKMDHEDGLAPATNSVYAIDGSVNTATLRVLKRTANGTTITDTAYSYRASGQGTVTVAAMTPALQLFKLSFYRIRFDALAGNALNPFLISGDTTLITPTQTASWV